MERKKCFLFRTTSLISDRCVLQREHPIKLCGWGNSALTVTGKLSKDHHGFVSESTGYVKEDGTWELCFPALAAGGPYSLSLKSGDEQLEFCDIMIGDVWVCSGQSNMQLPMERVKYRFGQDYQRGFYPDIRQFSVPIEWNFHAPAEELTGGRWDKATTEFIPDFTAAGYFFAKTLYEKYQVPIGLILTAVGGTPIQAWMSRESLADSPRDIMLADQCKDDSYVKNIQKEDQERIAAWWHALDEADIGLKENWAAAQTDSSNWEEIDLGTSWETISKLHDCGSVWLQKEVEIPSELAGKPVRLSLGTIVDADITYLNGEVVGHIDYQYPPREYELSGLRKGRNTITIRVVAVHQRGGFTEGKAHELIWENGKQDISKGWKFRRAVTCEPLIPQTFFERIPMGMYQAMIAPLHSYPVKGILWYQGEENTGEPERYYGYFKAMIEDWRARWGLVELPFLYVQLPGYDLGDARKWIELRDAQRKALDIPNTAMAVTIDVGEYNDLHPVNKKAVGKRLAQAAMNLCYGENGVFGGPTIAGIEKEKDVLILKFLSAGAGLATRDLQPLSGFEVCCQGKYIPVLAVIRNDTIVITCQKTNPPTAIRYAWENNPQGANLCNREGFLASPFQIMLE